MSDILFVQFYDYIKQYNIYNLCNGFSDTYNLCKNRGDFYWLYHDLPDYNRRHLGYSNEFIISKGTVYVSASYISHLYRVYLWALRYPDIQFIVGGPCIMFSYWKTLKPLPNNIILSGKSVEEYFDISNFSYKWKLDVPVDVPSDGVISYNYFLEKYCYWRKCIFCAFTREKNICHRHRENINYEFMDVDHNGLKEVRLGSDSMSPDIIRNFFHNIPYMEDLKQYRVFMRPDVDEMNALKSLSGDFNIKFNMGLEYPSERMWNYMSKGYNYKSVGDTINYMASDERFKMILNIIIGWGNLIEQDLIDLKKFLESLEYSKDSTFSLHGLYILGYKDDRDPIEELVLDDVFYVGWKPRISKKQIELNEKTMDILKDIAEKKSVNYRIAWE